MLPSKSIALQPTTVPGATSRRVRYAPTITEMTSWALALGQRAQGNGLNPALNLALNPGPESGEAYAWDEPRKRGRPSGRARPTPVRSQISGSRIA